MKGNYLPPELEPEKGIDSIVFAEYPDSTIGPYYENLIMLSCRYKKGIGSVVFNIYVDSDDALTAGREIWGYPKKMCEIVLSPIQDNKLKGSLTRKGIQFLNVEVDLMDKPLAIDPRNTIGALPIYNLKIIPDVADNSKPILRQLTATYLEYGDLLRKSSVKTNYIKSEFSKYDICHEILKDANKNLGGMYLEGDLILPNGQLLE
jgi:acetoacetate decarboxylase